MHFLADPWAPHPVVNRNICHGGLFGGGGSPPPAPPMPVLAQPTPMPVPDPDAEKRAAYKANVAAMAGKTTRQSTIIGGFDDNSQRLG